VLDARWGEAIKAIVVLKPGMEATEQEIIAHFKVPRSVDFYEGALPKSGSGKILSLNVWVSRDSSTDGATSPWKGPQASASRPN